MNQKGQGEKKIMVEQKHPIKNIFRLEYIKNGFNVIRWDTKAECYLEGCLCSY